MFQIAAETLRPYPIVQTTVDQAQAGFDAIYARFENKVFRLCWSILGDRALAEEAAQEAFLRIWRGLPGFRGGSSLSTWVYAITRNCCLTMRRSLPVAPLPIDAARLVAAPQRRPEIDLAGEIALLPQKYRQVVMLFYMEECSYEEVAAMLDLPMGTVKTYLHRARKALALRLAQGKIEV